MGRLVTKEGKVGFSILESLNRGIAVLLDLASVNSVTAQV